MKAYGDGLYHHTGGPQGPQLALLKGKSAFLGATSSHGALSPSSFTLTPLPHPICHSALLPIPNPAGSITFGV